MKVLGIESSSTTASVAIIEDDKLLAEYTMNNTLKHSKTLMPMLQDLLMRLEMKVDAIDLVAVSEGPGSFTGLRIGSATAKGIAHGLGLSVASIPTLEVLASTVTVPDAQVGVIVFARAREVYYASYKIEFINGTYIPKEVESIIALEIDDLLIQLKEKELDGPFYLIGDGLQRFKSEFVDFKGKYLIHNSIFSTFSGKEVALLGLNRYYNDDVMTYYEQKPYYHKKSQAEREYEEKNK